MKQPVDLSQGHRSDCLAGEHNLPSLHIWPLIKVTSERCPSVLHCSCQARLGPASTGPCVITPRGHNTPCRPSVRTPYTRMQLWTTHMSLQSPLVFKVTHKALLLLQSPRPGGRVLCLLTTHRWTSWGVSPLTSLSNLYKTKPERTPTMTCAELTWRSKLEWFKVQT